MFYTDVTQWSPALRMGTRGATRRSCRGPRLSSGAGVAADDVSERRPVAAAAWRDAAGHRSGRAV